LFLGREYGNGDLVIAAGRAQEFDQIGDLGFSEIEAMCLWREAGTCNEAVAVVGDHFPQTGGRTVVHIGRTLVDVAERGRLESVLQGWFVRNLNAASDVVAFEAYNVSSIVGEPPSGMACRAIILAVARDDAAPADALIVVSSPSIQRSNGALLLTSARSNVAMAWVRF
jgi:hypothetical protein